MFQGESFRLSLTDVDCHYVVIISLSNGFNVSMIEANNLNCVSLFCNLSKHCTLAPELILFHGWVDGLFILGPNEVCRIEPYLVHNFIEGLQVFVFESRVE